MKNEGTGFCWFGESNVTADELMSGVNDTMAGDECARAVGMVLRWKSGKWKSKGLIEV